MFTGTQGRQFADALRLYEAYVQVAESRQLRDEVRRRIPVVHRQALQASVQAAVAGERAQVSTPAQPRTVAVFLFIYTCADATLRDQFLGCR